MHGFVGGFQFGALLGKGATASLGLPTVLAASEDRKEEDESRARDWRLMALVLKVQAEGELGMLDLSPSDLRFILASLASIWLCIESPTVGLRRTVVPGHSLQD